MKNYGLNRLLRDDELQKITSTDGIIELLCGIENFKSEDYDNLDESTRELIDYTMNINLISDTQIKGNLRRSFDAGNIALLNKKLLTALALLYFGEKDENGKYVKYICPYTGKEYNLEEIKSEKRKNYTEQDLDKVLELEHIMPHSSGGGTVLFNCIPASREANSVSEKGSLHLLDWLTNEESSGIKYYLDGGKERLDKLVKYMISAYEIAFSEYIESDLEFQFKEVENGEDEIEQCILDDQLENPEKFSKSKKIRQTQIEGYIPFYIQLIEKLKDEGYDVHDIEERFSEIAENINIEKYRVVQKVIGKLFEEENEKSYLTYGLNVDYVKLVNSIDLDDSDQIKEVICLRFNKIKEIVNNSGKSINDYFVSLKDIEDIDILYKQKYSEKEIQYFIDNIKLGLDGKINVFIEMLSLDEYTQYKKGTPDDNNIFGQNNTVKFKGYENIQGLTINKFWSHHSEKIKKRVVELQKKENITDKQIDKLKKAERAIDCYEFTLPSNLNKRIDCFIDMLSEEKYTQYKNGVPNDNNILRQGNKTKFKGYESIEGLNINVFWMQNSKRVKDRINELLNRENITGEQREKLKKAERAIECYEFTLRSNLNKRIDCFIDMLSEEEYTQYKGGIPDERNIFGKRNQIYFKGYENIQGLTINQFWGHNSEKIKQRVAELLKKENVTDEQMEKIKKAKRAIDCYEFESDINKKINCFIDMLSEEEYTRYKGGVPDERNVFGKRNQIYFKGYENIHGLTIKYFWGHNSEKIKQRVAELLKKENVTDEQMEKIKKAKRAIDCYEFTNSLDKRIDCFIDMLSLDEYTQYKNGKPDNQNIFSDLNDVKFKGYESIDGLNTGGFWQKNKKQIKDKIEGLLIDSNIPDDKKDKLKKAERAIDCYEFTLQSNLNKRIDCFIQMLNEEEFTQYKGGVPDNMNIFVNKNKVKFKGYEDIDGVDTSIFWQSNSTAIVSLLFYNKYYDNKTKQIKKSEKDYSGLKYDSARKAILEYAKVNNIDEYIKKVRSEKKKNTLISLKESTKDLTMSEIEHVGRKIQSIHRVKGVNEYGYENENRIR